VPSALSAVEQLGGSGQWQEQNSGIAGKRGKPVVAIKCRGRVILGVDEEGIISLLGAMRARRGIDQQQTAEAEAAPAKGLIDGEPSDPHRRQARIARQAAEKIGRQLAERDTGRGQRVVAGNGAAGGNMRFSLSTVSMYVPPRSQAELCGGGMGRNHAAGFSCTSIAIA
jgi:hypothetical protein